MSISNDTYRDDRTANSYIEAVNAVIDLLGSVKYIPKNEKGAAVFAAIQMATPVLKKVVPIVAPHVKKAAQAAADKAPAAMNAQAGKVADAAKGAAGKIAGVANKAGAAVHDAAEVRAQEKARKLARKTLLAGASKNIEAQSFLKTWDDQHDLAQQMSEETALATELYAFPGCYVVVTCDSAVKKDDFSSFREVYVGKSMSMGEALHDDFTGLGNPDVYADVKYKQHVYALLYPCISEKLDEMYTSLIAALDADRSYNAR